MNVAEAHAAIDALPRAEAIYQMLAHQLIEDVDADVEIVGAPGHLLPKVHDCIGLRWTNPGASIHFIVDNTDAYDVSILRSGTYQLKSAVPRDLVANLVDYVLHGWRSWEEYLAPSENAGASDQRPST